MTEPEQSTKRIVWVLGSGFSKPLGGPMLADLLSPASANDTHFRYPEPRYPKLHAPLARSVRLLYERGRTDGWVRLSDETEIQGERMWSNAEDFIDYIDTAAALSASDSEHWLALRLGRILKSIPNCERGSPDKLRAMARRLIAAECCGFLEGGTDIVRREQWEPYRDWVKSVGNDDTVVSFNYDRVVEMLCKAEGCPVAVVTPISRDEKRTLRPGCWPLLKLHGSVDWKRRESNRPSAEQAETRPYVADLTADPNFALTCEDVELAIATPGPSKQETAIDYGDLWSLAQDALANADAIVFVGYRFPETDAHARKMLLEPIRKNHDTGRTHHHLSLHVVLAATPTTQRALQRCCSMFVAPGAGSTREMMRARNEPFECTSTRFSLRTSSRSCVATSCCEASPGPDSGPRFVVFLALIGRPPSVRSRPRPLKRRGGFSL